MRAREPESPFEKVDLIDRIQQVSADDCTPDAQRVKRVEVLERHEIIYLDVQVQELVYISEVAAEQLKIDLAADIVVGPERVLQDGMI
jgi:hypothetical protein